MAKIKMSNVREKLSKSREACPGLSEEVYALVEFMSNVAIQFVKEYNRYHNRVGPLFSECFGSAPKAGLKLLRTAIAYLFNNPVERLLCKRAQEYRWNFLAYAASDNPFSDPLVLKKASRRLRRALKEVDGGINRCTLNTETVLFTPYQPWGFRITLFGFADFGLLGNHANPFQNDFYSAIGVGIRIKNERLIFSAIQLQLGIAFGKAGLLNDRWYRFSSQRSLNEFRFRPEAPIPVSYD